MEKKQSSKNKGYSTLLGLGFAVLFNGLLIAVLSWFLLVLWLSVRLFFFNECDIQKVINFYSELLVSYKPVLAYGIRATIQQLESHLTKILMQLIDLHRCEAVITILIGNLEIIILKVALFLLWLPFFALIGFLAVVDGLVQRDIRKFQGARESTFLFHRIKPLIGTTVTILYLCYMVCPLAVRPEYFLMPLALISGLFIMLAIKGFKKYL